MRKPRYLYKVTWGEWFSQVGLSKTEAFRLMKDIIQDYYNVTIKKYKQ